MTEGDRAAGALVGAVVRRRRIELGISQNAFAKKLGMKQSVLSRLEAGKMPWYMERLAFVAHALGTVGSEIVKEAGL